MPYFQDVKVIAIPAAGIGRYTLPVTAPLDNLTIWAVGKQPVALGGITAQPKLNNINYGGSTVFPTTAPVNGSVFVANNPVDGRRIIPMNRPQSGSTGSSVFVFTVDFTAVGAEEVVVYAVADQLTG
jgi:hypothetical protein